LLSAALSTWLKFRHNAADPTGSVIEPYIYNSHVLHACDAAM